MRGMVGVGLLAGLATLGCAGLGEAFDEGMKSGLHDQVMEECTRYATDDEWGDHVRDVCGCVADDLVATGSASEVMDAMKDEAYVRQLFSDCAEAMSP